MLSGELSYRYTLWGTEVKDQGMLYRLKLFFEEHCESAVFTMLF